MTYVILMHIDGRDGPRWLLLSETGKKDGYTFMPLLHYVFRTRLFSISITTHKNFLHGFADMIVGEKQDGSPIWSNKAYISREYNEQLISNINRRTLVSDLVSVARKNIALEMLNSLQPRSD